jgi:choice-of-anchor B domain-containing protein
MSPASTRILVPAAALLLIASCGSDPNSSPNQPVTPSGPTHVTASGLPSPYNMVLEAHLDLGTLGATAQALHDAPAEGSARASGAGCWGYTAPDGRRFALMGTSSGLAVADVSDPQKSRFVALIPGAQSAWREVRTFRTYAYVSTEAKTGLDIIDLKDPDRPRKVRTWNTTFTSAHTVWIDEGRGLLFANGTSSGMHVLDLLPDPEEPREVGVFRGFYIHDSYSRGNTLYASAIYDGFLALLDVGDPGNIREITRFATGSTFTHNAWLSRDGRYVFTTDEVRGAPAQAWDLADPKKPQLVSDYLARPGSIPHNVLVDGDRLVIAHYTEGVHMLDVRDPTRPRVLGFYDTFDGVLEGFHGTWGAYIFPNSNLLLASDIEGGLFVVRYTGS